MTVNLGFLGPICLIFIARVRWKSGAPSLKLTITYISDNFCLSVFGQGRNWSWHTNDIQSSGLAPSLPTLLDHTPSTHWVLTKSALFPWKCFQRTNVVTFNCWANCLWPPIKVHCRIYWWTTDSQKCCHKFAMHCFAYRMRWNGWNTTSIWPGPVQPRRNN